MTGTYLRNACTAGYKGQYVDGHYPSATYLGELNPAFADFPETRLDAPIGELGQSAGTLTEQAAQWMGLHTGVVVAVGNVDAHVSAPAAQAVEPGRLVAIMGTSTCHVMSADVLREVPGMCGVVDGGIVPGLWGYEAGQSGVGDIFGWYVDNQVPKEYADRAAAENKSVHELLTELAAEQPVGAHGLLALDWHSGNRSPLVDHELSGVFVGQTLATRPEDGYRALLEATAYGTRLIIETFRAAGVPVDELVVTGGLQKNPLMMQIYADVTRLPINLLDSEQGPALGSALHAAVAAGAYPDIRAAAASMGRVVRDAWLPDEANAVRYDAIYEEYTTLVDYFGRHGNDVMRRLRKIRREALR
ncbi:MAG: ribulokinase [Actinoplanes sp.]